MTNFFYPQQKLRSKQRQGAKVIKKYDVATTPYRGPTGRKEVPQPPRNDWWASTPNSTRGPAAAGPSPEQRAARHDHIQGSKGAETTRACTRKTDLSAGIGIWSEHVARELNVR